VWARSLLRQGAHGVLHSHPRTRAVLGSRAVHARDDAVLPHVRSVADPSAFMTDGAGRNAFPLQHSEGGNPGLVLANAGVVEKN